MTTQYKCYDCGSTIPGHHTPMCEMAEDYAIRNLGQQSPTVQWWDRAQPAVIDEAIKDRAIADHAAGL